MFVARAANTIYLNKSIDDSIRILADWWTSEIQGGEAAGFFVRVCVFWWGFLLGGRVPDDEPLTKLGVLLRQPPGSIGARYTASIFC